MQAERLKKLLDYIKQEPNDPLNHYLVALEYQKSYVERSLKQFQHLLNYFPDYLPTYYHAAALFFELEEIEKAFDTYEKGILVAQKAGNLKAEKELRSAYQQAREEFEM